MTALQTVKTPGKKRANREIGKAALDDNDTQETGNDNPVKHRRGGCHLPVL